MLNTFFWYVYRLPLSVVWCLIAFAVIVWALLMRWLSGRHPRVAKYGNLALVVVALGGILYITVLRNNPGKQELILQPFQSFIEAKQQKEMYREMLMNVLLFVPFGLTVPFALTPVKDAVFQRNTRYAVIVLLITIALSVSIEAVQYHYALGRCETDDVLCNTLGALFGVCAYLLQFPKRQKP